MVEIGASVKLVDMAGSLYTARTRGNIQTVPLVWLLSSFGKILKWLKIHYEAD